MSWVGWSSSWLQLSLLLLGGGLQVPGCEPTSRSLSSSSSSVTTTTTALWFCWGVSSVFVGSLYLLVPPRVRRLPRHDKEQIKWRSLASGITCLFAVVVYQILFCQDDNNNNNEAETTAILMTTATNTTTTTTSLSLFWDWMMRDWIPRNLWASLRIWIHVGILYLGPLMQSAIEVHIHYMQTTSSNSMNDDQTSSWNLVHLLSTCYHVYLDPVLQHVFGGDGRTTRTRIIEQQEREQERWIDLRNYLIAPLTEEFVFRGLIVPALWRSMTVNSDTNHIMDDDDNNNNNSEESVIKATAATVTRLCWMAPLFFGIAHIHHALQRMLQLLQQQHHNNNNNQGGGRQQRDDNNNNNWFSIIIVLISTTLFQFTYTTLFGAYASYVYWQTKSLLAVTLVHSFCNYMGLPNLAFCSSSSLNHYLLYPHRYMLWMAHIVGILAFFQWFSIFTSPL